MRWAPGARLWSGWERRHPWLLWARPVGMAQVLRTVPKPFRHVACYALNRNCLAFLPSSRSMKTRRVSPSGWGGMAQCRVRAEPVEGSVHPGDRPGVETWD